MKSPLAIYWIYDSTLKIEEISDFKCTAMNERYRNKEFNRNLNNKPNNVTAGISVSEIIKTLMLVDVKNADPLNATSMSDNNGGRIIY